MARTKKLRKYPSSTKVFFPDGREPEVGQIWKNPELARTLRRLVEAERESAGKGRHAALQAARDRFYKGDIAREMARFSEENGGLFRYEDFASYTATIEEPIFVDYRGYRVYKNPSANQGPTELFLLNLLEGYDLKALKLNTPEYLHISAEAAKLAFADREKYLGDMDFVKIPYEGLLSKDYAQERRKLIDDRRASAELRPGVAEKFAGMEPLERPLDYKLAGKADHEGDTSYIAVVDKDRNLISFTPSLHQAFGTGVVMGDLGFTFNCRGDYYSLMPGTAERACAGKKAAQHPAIDPGDQRRKAADGDGQSGRRRPVPAHHADVPQHGGVRDERAAGDRGPEVDVAGIPVLALPARNVSERPRARRPHPARRAEETRPQGSQSTDIRPVVDRLERRDRDRPGDRRDQRRRRPARGRVRPGLVALTPRPSGRRRTSCAAGALCTHCRARRSARAACAGNW